MAKRAKPKVREIKSSPLTQVDDGQLHQVVLIERGTYWDAKCQSCGRGAICGGYGAKELLTDWANWHAKQVEIAQA